VASVIREEVEDVLRMSPSELLGLHTMMSLDTFYRGQNNLCWARGEHEGPAVTSGCSRFAGECKIGLCAIHCAEIHTGRCDG